MLFGGCGPSRIVLYVPSECLNSITGMRSAYQVISAVDSSPLSETNAKKLIKVVHEFFFDTNPRSNEITSGNATLRHSNLMFAWNFPTADV